MKKTPLYDLHVEAGGRIVDYAGWALPVQYSGIAEETAAVRQDVGLFDVSHMGEIEVRGADAGAFLDWLLTRRVTGKQPDQITYAILCAADGGVVDDLLVYQTGAQAYLLAVNAANKDKDLVHIGESIVRYQAEHGGEIEFSDLSDQYAQLALQGPNARARLAQWLDGQDLSAEKKEEILNLRRFRQAVIADETVDWIISRTGYTGEDGYEFYVPAACAVSLWQELVALGTKPCALGARDALRMEAGLPLYGHEISADINPLDGGLGRFVDFSHSFQGEAMKDNHRRKILPLASLSRAIPRDGYRVFVEGVDVGVVVSGTFSPTLGRGIANALIDLDAAVGDQAEVEIRGRRQPFEVVSWPFVELG